MVIILNIIITVVALKMDGKNLYTRETSKSKFCIPTTILTSTNNFSCHFFFFNIFINCIFSSYGHDAHNVGPENRTYTSWKNADSKPDMPLKEQKLANL